MECDVEFCPFRTKQPAQFLSFVWRNSFCIENSFYWSSFTRFSFNFGIFWSKRCATTAVEADWLNWQMLGSIKYPFSSFIRSEIESFINGFSFSWKVAPRFYCSFFLCKFTKWIPSLEILFSITLVSPQKQFMTISDKFPNAVPFNLPLSFFSFTAYSTDF